MIRLGSDKNFSGTTIVRLKKNDPQRQFPKKIYQEGKYGIPVVQPSRAESMVMVIMVAMDIMIVGHHDRHRCHGHDHHFIHGCHCHGGHGGHEDHSDHGGHVYHGGHVVQDRQDRQQVYSSGNLRLAAFAFLRSLPFRYIVVQHAETTFKVE